MSNYTEPPIPEYQYEELSNPAAQAFLVEVAAALDAMPEKVLISYRFISGRQCCAVGAVLLARGATEATSRAGLIGQTLRIDPKVMNIITIKNDERQLGYDETPEQRWLRMRSWVQSQIKKDK